MCNIEKHNNNFYKKNSFCKDCINKRGVKRYFNNKDRISIQQKIYYEKNRDKLLQKQNDYTNKRNTDYKELLRSYAELENKLEALEENFKINDSENNQNFYKRNLFQTSQKKLSPDKTDVLFIDNIWSLDILDLKDYGPENNRGYRYVLVIIDNFSKFGWTVPLKNKIAQTIKDSFEKICITSKKN